MLECNSSQDLITDIQLGWFEASAVGGGKDIDDQLGSHF